jgi:hypothetical protein
MRSVLMREPSSHECLRLDYTLTAAVVAMEVINIGLLLTDVAQYF